MTTRTTTDNITDGTITDSDLGALSKAGIDWQSVVTTNTTMVAGKGYFVNTTGGAVTMTLPASPSIGDTIVVVDYSSAATNNITISRNGSNIQSAASDRTISTNNTSETYVYINATVGWQIESTTLPPPDHEFSCSSVTRMPFLAITRKSPVTERPLYIAMFTAGNICITSNMS